MYAAFFAPGPTEIVILMFLGLVVIGVPIAVPLAVLAITRKSGRSARASAPCPSCGGEVVPGARFCHHCGTRLG